MSTGNLAAGRRSARRRRRRATRSPGRMPAPISTRSGTPTTTATTSQIYGLALVSGTSYALQSLETSFHQDLNGDGQIGLVTTVIETQGSTNLTHVADHYFLYDSVGSGPSLKYAGADVVAGNLAAGRRSARSRRRPAMRLPGRMPAPISTRSGTPTTTATTSQITVWRLVSGASYALNRSRRASIRISTATGRSGW